MPTLAGPIPASVRLAQWKAEACRLKAAADAAAAELARLNRELDRAQAYVRDYASAAARATLSPAGQLPVGGNQPKT